MAVFETLHDLEARQTGHRGSAIPNSQIKVGTLQSTDPNRVANLIARTTKLVEITELA